MTSSNDVQSLPNPDGTTTFVISKQDPGVHNWIDTRGLNYPKIMLRWQQLPRDEGAPPPRVKGEIVKISDLEGALPEGVRFVTPGERQRQLDERWQAHNTRYAEH